MHTLCAFHFTGHTSSGQRIYKGDRPFSEPTHSLAGLYRSPSHSSRTVHVQYSNCAFLLLTLTIGTGVHLPSHTQRFTGVQDLLTNMLVLNRTTSCSCNMAER